MFKFQRLVIDIITEIRLCNDGTRSLEMYLYGYPKFPAVLPILNDNTK